jgi:hypothetical protein
MRRDERHPHAAALRRVGVRTCRAAARVLRRGPCEGSPKKKNRRNGAFARASGAEGIVGGRSLRRADLRRPSTSPQRTHAFCGTLARAEAQMRASSAAMRCVETPRRVDLFVRERRAMSSTSTRARCRSTAGRGRSRGRAITSRCRSPRRGHRCCPMTGSDTGGSIRTSARARSSTPLAGEHLRSLHEHRR